MSSGLCWKPVPVERVDRRRTRERVEASLAGLKELQLRRMRQERRVRGALRAGGTGDQDQDQDQDLEQELDQDRDLEQDPSTPLGLSISLEQQVAKLKVNLEPTSADSSDLEHIQLSSGEAHLSDHDGSTDFNPHCENSVWLSAQEGNRETELRQTLLSDPTIETITDAFGIRKIRVICSQQDYQTEEEEEEEEEEIYIFELMERRALSARLPQPNISLLPDPRTTGVLSGSSCTDEHQSKGMSISETSPTFQYTEETNPACLHPDIDPYLISGFPEEPPPPYHHQPQQSVHRQRGLYRATKQSSVINGSHAPPFECPPYRVGPAPPESSTRDSHQHYQDCSPSSDSTKPHKVFPSEEQLVSAQYIPAQPCRASAWSYAHHHHSNPYQDSGVNKLSQDNCSPERSYHGLHQQSTAPQNQPRERGGPKKCRSHEDRCASNKKPGSKAFRSQAENSQQRVSEHKSKTAEREGAGGGSCGKESRRGPSKRKKQQHGGGRSKGCQSTMELSQDEGDLTPTTAVTQGILASNPRDYCLRRPRRPHPSHGSYVHPQHNPHHPHHHHPQHLDYQPERNLVQRFQSLEKYPEPGQDETESSKSDDHSPHSSSLSSSSEESLVFPQQSPPNLPLPSASTLPGAPLQPKAFVKIKASHALKKKILRFRNGSLKVMTTV